MTDQTQNDLELQIDDLLNDGLEPRRRLELLSLIAHDDHSRGILRNALALKQSARAACGLDEADAVMAASLERLKKLLGDERTVGKRSSYGAAAVLLRPFKTSTLLRVAAVVVITVSIYVAVVAHRTDLAITDVAVQPGGAMIASPTERELAGYRIVWSQIADQTDLNRPWVLLCNGRGQFGYLPTVADTHGGDESVLVRCVLIDTEGKSVRTLNVLLPARQRVQLSIPDAGCSEGRPIRCDVWASDHAAGVGLTVDDRSTGPSGAQGRTSIGADPIEIGQFLVDGNRLRVVLQAVPLNVATG